MNGSERRVSAQGLMEFTSLVLQKAGVPAEDAAICADVVVGADMSGVDTHGVVRLSHYMRRLANGTIKARPRIRFQKKARGAGIMDGDDGLGHVVMVRACDQAARLSARAGCSFISIRNSSHFGTAGYYARRLAASGLASMVMTTSDAFLIPFGASRPFFGTNPIAIGFPADPYPVVLDMATTSIPYGKIVLAKQEGQNIPADWGFDAEGRPTQDPHQIVGLHPIAGPKGSGLAMVIDILCSLLSGMAFGPHINKMYGQMEEPRGLGHFVVAWDISRMLPLTEFTGRLKEMVTELGQIPPADGFDRVFYPGEIEGGRIIERQEAGIPIQPGLWDDLQSLAAEYEVPTPQ